MTVGPGSPAGITGAPGDPVVGLGESPFNETVLLRDNHFDAGETWWNFTNGSGGQLLAGWAPPGVAWINHSSPPSSGEPQTVGITRATYDGVDKTEKLDTLDSKNIRVYKTLVGRIVLDVEFEQDLSNGDSIGLVFDSGNPCTITVRDPGSQSPPAYGNGEYDGGEVQAVHITLSGLDAPQRLFNLDIDFAYVWWDAYLNYISALYTPGAKDFEETAYVNQAVTTPRQFNLSYNLNFSYRVVQFRAVHEARLSLMIGQTTYWSAPLTGVSGWVNKQVKVPTGVLQNGGTHDVVFAVYLRVFTTEAVDFKVQLDDAHLKQGPFLDLLDDSPCDTGVPWTTASSSTQINVTHDARRGLFQFATSGGFTGGNSGWGRLSQDFTRNSSRTRFSFEMRLFVANLTNVNFLNLTVKIGGVYVIPGTVIDETTDEWQTLRANATPALPSDGDYTLDVQFDVDFPLGAASSVNWTTFVDDVYVYPLWDSTLTREPGFDGNVTVGLEKRVDYYYNATATGEPIPDAEVVVYNNDTGVEWGLGVTGARKYAVTNYANGSYEVRLSTVGFQTGVYNLSVTFFRPNFPATNDFLQLNLTGLASSVTITDGAHYNATHGIWFVDEDNTPYVNDKTRTLELFVQDTLGEPILDAFVEATLGSNLLSFTEVYKATGDPADQGYYVLILDTTGVAPVLNYLELNFSIVVTAEGYSANTTVVSTKVALIPTAVAIPQIDPFYEGSPLSLAAIFQDTFHETSIDEGTLTWEIEGTAFAGTLDFVFLGYYQSLISTTGLPPGNYTLRVDGSKQNYQNATLERDIEVLPKWNVTIEAFAPSQVVEGNTFQVTFNLSHSELGTPLSGESVEFNVTFAATGGEEVFTTYSGEDGLVKVTVNVPLGETSVVVTAKYGGEYNLTAASKQLVVSVVPRFGVVLELLGDGYPPELVGEGFVEVQARLAYENGTALVGAPLTFRIGTSEATAVTGNNGTATASIKLPTEGKFRINVTYAGTNLVKSGSTVSSFELNVVSPTTVAIRRAKQLATVLGAVAAAIVGAYVAIDRGVVRPKQRRRHAAYVSLLNQFEDARNLQLLMVINVESGTEVYSKSLGGVPVDPTLVSGFLQAITQFGEELVAGNEGPTKRKTGGLQELAFHHFKIITKVTEHFRVALLLLKAPSKDVVEALDRFSMEVEKKFGQQVAKLPGRTLTDQEVFPLVDRHFKTTLTYLHMLDCTVAETAAKNRWERVVLEFIRDAHKGEAYLDKVQDELAPKQVGKELELLQAALSLREAQVLVPLAPEYVEFRLGIHKAIAGLPEKYKALIHHVGDGVRDPTKLVALLGTSGDEFDRIARDLKELAMITEDFRLDMPGKVVLTHLRTSGWKPNGV
ncbi:MAG: hypothetical protein Kow0069_30730 [Promethearchaeota archaeon]